MSDAHRQEGRAAEATSSIPVLDDALDRVSALDFEIPNPFVNHGPMACEALATLDLASRIPNWVEGFEASMGEAVRPVTPAWHEDFAWRDRLGDHRVLPEWMGYYEQAIDDEGWRDVVRLWVPRLMPGLVSALFHGVIRTAHATRALSIADTRARRAELARALGNWAVWYGSGQSIEGIADGDDPSSDLVLAAAEGARFYLTDPNIFNLHGITGAMAVHLLAGELEESDGKAAVLQLKAEHRSLHAGVRATRVEGPTSGWDHEVESVASASYDPHQVKLVEACRRGFELTHETAFVAAAQRVTSSDLP